MSRKIKKSDFYKNKKIFSINDIDANNILVSKKKKNMVNIIHFSTLLGIMIILLNHYI